ncbi:leukocyte receptor cluster member 8 homolog isoform X2 [Frankliniella occidentalis]|uniref:Leukocyte receptor cluster member 8 homolog isoform X2 n=1 Tax=Frankliniella occidentalis TaxID=133901 RepID=A0A6J1TV33_FRAOC|nr:leukocyte receptor cluster member 8 homolog isoform X2 [Frankliniella occidentalis]
MADKGQNPSMWQYPPYPPYGQGYQGYGQPGYGYPNQYYGMQQYQQGMGYPYGGGSMGSPGQGPPLPPGPHGSPMQGFTPPGGSKEADPEAMKDENNGKTQLSSASPGAPPGEEELIPLPSGTPPPPSNGLPPGFSPRQNNFFPNQVPNNPFAPIRFNINHKNRMQYPFNQNNQPGVHQGQRPNAPNNPAALLQPNAIGQPGQPMMSKKKRKRAKQLALQAAAAAAAAAATNTGGSTYSFVKSFEPLTSVANPNNIPPLPPNPPPPDNPPPLPPLPEEPQTPSAQPPLPPAGVGTTPPAPPAAPAGADTWPESLKNYVKMCYDRCKTGVDKDRVEIILKGKIMSATNKKTLWTKNWEEEELPKLSADLLPSPRNFGNMQRNNIAKPMTPNRGIAARLSLGNKFNKGQIRRQSRRSSSSPSPSRSRSRSRSRRKSRSRSHSRSRSRSRSRSDSSHSSHRRRKRSSSSSSADDFKSLKVGKGRAQRGRLGDRLSFPGKGRGGTVMNKKAKHPKGVLKSHFYSEFGGNTEELGNSEQLQKRAARFSAITRSPSNPTALLTPQNNRHKRISMSNKFSEDTEGDFDLTECHVVGTCQEIEKRYLRLTSAPDPSQVRPVEVLKIALNRAKDKWLKSEDYHASCDQLKSIRQDLTVQGIRDQFTVYVYETHARIAMEKGDHEEFNQCQTQLKMLYADLGGENVNEFTAYRILYYIFTKNNLDLTVVMASLTPEAEQHDCIAHALNMRSAWWLGNYHKFFKLYRAAPKMAAYLVDWFADRERKAAIKIMIKSYVLTLSDLFVFIYYPFLCIGVGLGSNNLLHFNQSETYYQKVQCITLQVRSIYLNNRCCISVYSVD